MKRTTVNVVVYSAENCNDSIVKDLLGIDRYLSRWLRDRVRVSHECICSSNVSETKVTVDGVEIARNDIPHLVDAIHFAAVKAA